MTRPAAPGPRLGQGRLRVDAARAIAKLREYQLVERAAWVLEGIRAAVASSATAITLSGDANDIWLSWRGEPWPIEDLTRLFDELVSPEAANERHHVRLLAAAVNSGLGLKPAYIDVIAIADTATRARYTPDVLDDFSGDLADSALRKLSAESIAVPEGAERGMRVHLRRRAGLEVLSYLLGEPPELAIARGACADIPVALTIGTTAYHRVDRATDVIRVPLGDGLDGFLAITDPETTTGAVTEVAERGVILERYPLVLGDQPLAHALPIRLLIDAPRMPTNASRSQVQRAGHPIAAAERRVAELMPRLATELVARLGVKPVSPRARAAALAVLAALVDGSDWRRTFAVTSSELYELANLPLLRDATGAPRHLLAVWRGLIYRGREPLPPDLAPWVDDILWVPPGDPVERLVARAVDDRRALRHRLRWARQQRRAHDRFFAHAARPPTVLARSLPLLRARLGAEVLGSCVPQVVFADLDGEVCIYADDHPSELVVLHHGREIERIELASPIRFAAVIDAKDITPDERYRGVVRDAGFARVDRAMRAGVLRAVEAIASDTRGAGFVAGEPIDIARFVHLIHGGLALARSLGASIAPPLASAPAWRTAGGEYVAHAALASVPCVGVVEPWIEVAAIAGRLMLHVAHAERVLLATLAPDLVQIPYGATTAQPASPTALASRLMLSNTFALAISEDTRGGAIGPTRPTETSTVTLHHRGIALDTRPYAHQLLPCKILVDSDSIVPGDEWDRVLDEGTAAGNYLPWEIALARVAARALTGDRSLDLFGPSEREIELHGPLCLGLWSALGRRDATELLGAELLGHLRAQRMWPVLGDPHPTSIDQLLRTYPAMIPYVPRGSLPVAGFSPVIADDLVAAAVATLAGLPVREASLELESHRHAAVRAHNLAAHRARPEQPLAVDSPGETVTLEGPIVRGVVGVAPIAMEIQVFVEARPFHVIRRDDLLPLCATVEIDASLTMPAFDGLPDDVTAEIIARVMAAAPDLLVAIAAARPHVLGDPGSARALFARWARLAGAPRATVVALRTAPMFLTVQGARTSVVAAGPELRTTTWTGTWLARENDRAHPCDEPILQLTDASGELTAIVDLLHDGVLADVTEDVAKLQATRRMERGLLPKPTIHGVGPELKRSLGELGALGRELGAGEIALVGDERSSALLHVNGELRRVVPIDVAPVIQIAIEAPDLVAEIERDAPLPAIAEQLRALQLDGPTIETRIPQAESLAILLARELLANAPFDSITPPIRKNLVRAMFIGVLPPDDLAGKPVFETTAPSWIDPVAVDGQVALFGNVWSVPTTESVPPPLDDRRIILRLDAGTAALAEARGVQIIDATEELALDAAARRNQDKPRATTLALPHASQILAQVTLAGDGVTGPRGVVGVLHPAAAQLRGIHVHRQMHPFAPSTDDFTWPVIATIDDARLAPDRTWEHPVEDEVWRPAIEAIRTASAQAFLDLVKPPKDALASQPLLGHGFGARPTKYSHLRGALWIAGPPLSGTPVHVIGASGAWDWVPAGDTGLSGVVYVHGADQDARILEALCEEIHGSLVRAMLRRPARDPQLVAAHAAHALSLGRIAASEATTTTFACFRPAPLSALELAVLFSSTDRVHVVNADSDQRGVIDDGSAVSRVVLARVRSRIARELPRQGSAPVAPPMEPDHPLRPLVHALRARFAQLGLELQGDAILEREAPMFTHDEYFQIAGDHPRLRALGAALAAGSPWAPAALDAVVAHGVTVLNVSLGAVTDAAEGHALRALLGAGARDEAM